MNTKLRIKQLNRAAREVESSVPHVAHLLRQITGELSVMTQPDPTALELQKFNELFQRDPLEAVKFAKDRGFAIDSGVLPETFERADAALGSNPLLRAHADPEVARQALRTKAAKYYLDNGQTPEEHLKTGLTDAFTAGDLDKIVELRGFAEEYGLPEWQNEANLLHRTAADRIQRRDDAVAMATREAGGRELGNETIVRIRTVEQQLRAKYGLDKPQGMARDALGNAVAPQPNEQIQRLYEQERAEAVRQIQAEHAEKMNEIRERVSAELTTPDPPAAA